MHKQLLLGLSLAVALSGCQKKAEGQTVAVVNKDEITSSELNGELANAKLPADVDKKEATNRILQGLIDRRLLADQARQEGIDQSPEFISRQRRMNEELLIGMLASRQMDASKLPTDAEIAAFQNKYPQAFAKREVWKLAQVQYQTPADPAVKAKILQTKSIDELIAVLTAARIPFQRANNQIATNVIPPDMYPRLASMTSGEPFIVPNGTASVASSVTSREPAPLVGPPARTEAVNLIRRQQSGDALQQRLKDLRKSAKIEYKEGFGPPK
ncbi:peptidylprolyl isomerase [Sphingomonas sp. KRR8]|uniref:SurA N-terminal domain-containing protein n=1 Tax=Sphingomonas sp. KRR8 TaxID=2942996 RepID=UPI0020216F7E|nr:SurA N-terminal domain-containing protein [Sphingomonas sp. KRR8]URD61619.1 peptidylprolyl isomerase [Sphingomonas sp. KRR8]